MKKRIIAAVLAGCMCITLLYGCGNSKKADNGKDSLTLFNYGEYIDPDVLDQFTEETGIEIKYEEALTPEEMYTKYKSGAIKYDLMCTSDYMIQKLIDEGELQKIDINSMEYKDNIDQKYWKLSNDIDPGNQYSVPYFWGTVGILYNTKKVKEPIDSWEVLFNHEYSGEIIMQNSIRDLYMVALKYLGYSLNTEDEDELRAAQNLLLEQKADVQAYLVDEARDEVVAENAVMAVIYSGEAYLGEEYNEDLAYVIPKEGSNLWVDSWCVTKYCKNPENAETFLNFLCRDDIAQKNFDYIYYSTPNNAVIDSLPEEDKNNEALVPSEDATDNCEVSKKLPDDTTKLMNYLWKELKAE
ncbi:MAG: ABC transporter substrate-binding protein [Hespellia sp.]|nr:ABC transporter substrate-binding protein [Hespellia sp.]